MRSPPRELKRIHLTILDKTKLGPLIVELVKLGAAGTPQGETLEVEYYYRDADVRHAIDDAVQAGTVSR